MLDNYQYQYNNTNALLNSTAYANSTPIILLYRSTDDTNTDTFLAILLTIHIAYDAEYGHSCSQVNIM